MSNLLETRFMSKVAVDPSTGCWVWQASRNPRGYGSYGLNGKTVLAHRHSYETLVGPIPEGLVIDHAVCQNTSCVNPAHLEAVTQRENVRRGNLWKVHGGKTHCKRGHEFTDENTRLRPNAGRSGGGGRTCLECERERHAASYVRVPRVRYRKTHCSKGHEFSEENSYFQPSNGIRRCKECNHNQYLARRAAQ